MSGQLISIVVPLLNEEDSLRELHERIVAHVPKGFAYEIWFIDDGSTDGSWDVISRLAEFDTNVHGLRLRRNYGKSAALQMGFDNARGEFVITMDADLQDDPAEIPGLIARLEEGLDLVSGWKKVRYDPITKTVPSRFFNAVTRWVSGIPLHDFNCGLKAYRRDVVKDVNVYGEMHRYVPLLAYWQGYRRIGEQVVAHHPRKHGKTKFGLSRFINGFLDLVSIVFINKYLQRPMHFFGGLGTLFFSAGAVITTYLVVMRVLFNEYLSGRPLFILAIFMVVLGVQLFSTGLLAEMMTRNRSRGNDVNVRESVNND
jgi:glycosyltransferase involved in cell wall biosynthesis